MCLNAHLSTCFFLVSRCLESAPMWYLCNFHFHISFCFAVVFLNLNRCCFLEFSLLFLILFCPKCCFPVASFSLSFTYFRAKSIHCTCILFPIRFVYVFISFNTYTSARHFIYGLSMYKLLIRVYFLRCHSVLLKEKGRKRENEEKNSISKVFSGFHITYLYVLLFGCVI